MTGKIGSDSSTGMPKNFGHRIALLKQGEHLCSVYRDTGEMLTQVVPYLKAGLLHDERCIYVADENNKDLIIHALKFWRVDADVAINSGRLVFWTRHDYRQPGPFNLNAMLHFVQRTLDQALADRRTGIRLAVEMSWVINNEVSEEDLIRWEDFINTISFPGSKVSFICQYNRCLHSSHVIAKVVRVHPVVVFGQDICPNRHCRSARDVLSAQDDHSLESILTEINTSASV